MDIKKEIAANQNALRLLKSQEHFTLLMIVKNYYDQNDDHMTLNMKNIFLISDRILQFQEIIKDLKERE